MSSGLARSLTLVHALLYGVGVTIGAGIYVLVGVVAGRSGMHAPVTFLLSSIALAPTAAVFAELGTRLPVSASEPAYVAAAFGRRGLTLAMGLLVLLTATISAATISAGSAGYVASFLALPGAVIVTGVVLMMGAVAGLATRQAIAVAGAMTLIEVGGLMLLLGGGALGDVPLLARLPELLPAPADLAGWRGIGSGALLTVFAFIGFEHLVNISEEIRDPGRTLPRALFLTLVVTTVLYALVAWTAVAAVPPAELAASPAPLALVFERLTGLPQRWMAGIAIAATLNGIVVHVIMIARVLYGMAAQGNLPRALAAVDARTTTPLRATAVATGAILVLALTVPLTGLAEFASRGTLLVFAGVALALIRIKWRGDPLPKGAFHCPTVVAWLALTGSLSLFALEFAR